MSYVYETERARLFTDEGQRTFIAIRDRVNHLLKEAGAVRMQEAIAKSTGDSWLMLASLDRMVELKELVELGYPAGSPPGQYRVFVRSWGGAA